MTSGCSLRLSLVGRQRPSTERCSFLLSPSLVANGHCGCVHTVPLRPLPLLPPAILSVPLDLHAVGGLCFDAIFVASSAGQLPLRGLVSLHGRRCWLGCPPPGCVQDALRRGPRSGRCCLRGESHRLLRASMSPHRIEWSECSM